MGKKSLRGGFGGHCWAKVLGRMRLLLRFIKKNKIKTTSKRPFPTGNGLFSGAVTALQLPFFWKDFHNKKHENQHINPKKGTSAFDSERAGCQPGKFFPRPQQSRLMPNLGRGAPSGTSVTGMYAV